MENKIDNLFKKFEGQLDVEVPDLGHFERFEKKLNRASKPAKKSNYAFIAVAASVVLMIGVWLGTFISGTQGMELAQVSVEMEETQNYFTTAIAAQLTLVEGERSEDTTQIIEDSLEQINRLELSYNNLTLELKDNSDDQRIIMAMIDNFQQRIEILQNLLIQIEEIKSVNTQNNEEYV